MKRARLRALCAVSVLAASGCSVTGLAERERSIALNRCDESSDCGEGTECVGGLCLAPKGTLSTFLFEVSPTLTSASLAGEQFFKVATVVPRAGGGYTTELRLNGATVQGRLHAASLADCALFFTGAGLQANDGSIPANITFIPRERTWGVSAPNLPARLELPTQSTVAPTTYPFTAQLPEGIYDVYVEPFAVESSSPVLGTPPKSCSLPPFLYRQLTIQGGTTLLTLSEPEPTRLTLEVRWPDASISLDGWSVDMLEPTSGRVISSRTKLRPPIAPGDLSGYTAALDYVPVAGDATSPVGGELVRLSPPADAIAPTLLFERGGLGLFSKDSAVIDQLPALPARVTLLGVVADSAGARLRANVTLSASAIDGVAAGTQASFIRTAQSDDNGNFEVELLPGTYVVHAAPRLSAGPGAVPFAALETTIKVAPSPLVQSGRAIVLQPAQALSGSVLLPNRDQGALGAVVTAEVSPGSVETSVFARALGALPLVPRAVGTVIDSPGGEFTLYADPGTFDLSVRPAEGSGFAWLVRPGVEVATVNQPLALQLPAPVLLGVTVTVTTSGASTVTSNLLTGANLRAYALLDASGAPVTDAEAAVNVIAVGEARLSDVARADVLLPAKLDNSSPD